MEVINLKLRSRGFSTSYASAGRSPMDQAQGNLGPGFGQADVELAITVSLLLNRLQQEEETRETCTGIPAWRMSCRGTLKT